MPRFGSYTLLALILSFAGCAALTGPSADPRVAAELSKRAYPVDAKLGADLDILVLTDGTNLQLINRTARSYHGMQLWLNQQWVGQAGTVAIGTGNQRDLNQFINRFGEPYPSGSLLQPEKAIPVVLAELYDPGANIRHRLVARRTGL